MLPGIIAWVRRTTAAIPEQSRAVSWYISNVFTTVNERSKFSEATGISKNNQFMVVGSSEEKRKLGSTHRYGAVYVYKYENNEWLEHLVVENPDLNLTTPSFRSFGASVEISEDFLAVTATDISTYRDTVFVYSLSNITAPIAVLVSPSHEFGQKFGWSLSIAGTKLIVSALEASVGGGKVFIYDLTATSVTLVQTIPAVPDISDFGFKLKTLDTTLVIGASGRNNNLSGVFVYNLVGNEYVFDVVLNDPSPTVTSGTQRDSFGRSLSLSEKYLIVGAPYSREQLGRVYVYEKINNAWTYSSAIDAPLSINNSGIGEAYTGVISNSFAYFGKDLSIYGERLAIGADYENGNSTAYGGSVYVFERNPLSLEWENKARFFNPITRDAGYFGHNVINTADNIIVGAWGNDNPSTDITEVDNDTGMMYVYKYGSPSYDKSTPASVITSSGARLFNIVLNTQNATVNTSIVPIDLIAGQVLRFGTTNIFDAYYTGDTVIRLLDPSMTEVAVNDDHIDSNGDTPVLPNNQPDRGSFINYAVTTTGTHYMSIGCYENEFCSGRVSWEILT